MKQYVVGISGHVSSEEDKVFEHSITLAKEKDPRLVESLNLEALTSRQGTFSSSYQHLALANISAVAVKPAIAPLCERCHYLKHHETGVSIHHPSIQSIQDTIFESPYKYNHVYHVIDAADFPMSMIPGLQKLLHMTPLRSLNRRSKTGRFYHGKKTEISFIITRSDLLAPKKEQVDSMMPYLRTVLRDSLGRAGTDVRLGNVRCISAKQGWWTKELKEDIWNRGGGGWMVGKVNVGKSQLFHEVFPKGRRGTQGFYVKSSASPAPVVKSAFTKFSPMAVEGIRHDLSQSSDLDSPSSGHTFTAPPGKGFAENGVQYAEDQELPTSTSSEIAVNSLAAATDHHELASTAQLDEEYFDDETLDTHSLLPPAQIETDYPEMPLVSSLPGTTASPIRVPFGNGKGELIDLPGLSRGDLELQVLPEHRSTLVMRSRVRPEQHVIKPGQSLLLGGFIRITPTTPDVVFLAYSFNPLNPHLTSTEKAIGTQTQTRESNVENISLPGTGEKVTSAGIIHLKWDVTKQRTGPITARDAARIRVERLPFRVMSADILIEGCGWVELTAQIRKRPGEMSGSEDRPSSFGEEEDVDPQWPTVEVFTPTGKFIGVRRPMNAWLNFAQKPSEKKASSRPRRSMKGMKKLTRQRARGKMPM